MNSQVVYADEKVRATYVRIKGPRTEDEMLRVRLDRAFGDLEKDACCGLQIRKGLIPKEYVRKYGINNLWKYNLPDGWRLIYSIGADDAGVLSIVLEWMDHKNYERRFGYK